MGTTAGTTVLGAFDPFEQIAAICKKHGVWMHVDGCWGAAALLSPEHRHLMKGCELSDSLAWNPHKLMGLPLQCSAFLTTHRGQKCLEGQPQSVKSQSGSKKTCLIMYAAACGMLSPAYSAGKGGESKPGLWKKGLAMVGQGSAWHGCGKQGLLQHGVAAIQLTPSFLWASVCTCRRRVGLAALSPGAVPCVT